jgi:hypothetical protein
MRRRDFIKVIVGLAAAWPRATLAQQTPFVIGYLAQGKLEGTAALVAIVRNGLGASLRRSVLSRQAISVN